MCNRPITQDGFTYACRTCDDCIATRRHNWVARAMMEKTQHKQCMVLALTYDAKTQANRDAAKMFAYVDVRGFLKRLRAAARYADPSAEIRFLCAGEQGSRNGRCHWHLVIYSGIDIRTLGEFQKMKSGKRQVVTDPAAMMTVGKHEVRLNWSIWGHGFVTLQEPDQGGMNYVLSYCLKDQFTHEKSRGTIREAKAENFATGLFRMSKRPAIGEAWLYQELAEIEAKGAVLPALKFKVPDFHGYYVPSGSFRQKALRALVEINDFIKWNTGANAPQWSSLLSSCQDNPPDLEVLTGVKTQEEESEFEFQQRLNVNAGETARKNRIYQTRRTCGRALPCLRCLGGFSDEKIESLGLYRYIGSGLQGDEWGYESKEGYPSFDERRKTATSNINPHCLLNDTERAREAFPRSAGGGSQA